ncbi:MULTISPECIES: sensor histidine kinase [Bacillus cereus group]|uniref:histidine kinase n=2 Tax=Bacillus cytotoxicus TaxID=580165 RepID=A0AAX2CM35_9BACI|nr:MULTISPECIES: sensor histidine kinase [Bacillus cereus group]ABS23692.1 integral membrane sensor signal transduction histidine kinase [Bacillus cytotoxicus NVH 391-98]AWC30278.1 sensor histidine kinase [Bacillus cytotoxicus]AWC42418.1 sensor histidine kinase [Bacillus cytotoxicus]AWC46303.1 sensor histidine kinase [Bacillus cytotoxicus]AWC50349.1 sensor histidine kinase [Bacillus cytotoxicus]
MRLFLRDHFAFFLLYALNFGIIFILYDAVDGFQNNKFYFIVLSLYLFICFLAYRYVRNRRMYHRLSEPPDKLEDAFIERATAPMPHSVNELVRTQYRLFQKELQTYEVKQQEHQLFINHWVHQMKTPVSVMQLMVLEMEDEQLIPKFKKELDRLNQGLDMALYMARLNNFHEDFHVETISLKEIVTKNINGLKELLIRNGVFPVLEVHSDFKVASDAKWLNFIIYQLMTNAVRYSGEHGKKVFLSAYSNGTNIVLEVRDEGVGIPKEDIRRVFEPFYTGKNGRTFGESTGMGLYIVSKICDYLGHSVTLDSEVGKGTSIKIIFHHAVNNVSDENKTVIST